MPRTTTRRSRFTVTTADGQKHVILAYGEQGAVDFYNARGQRVVGVRKGDHRCEGPGWTPDQAAIREACAMLGLRWEVRLSLTSRQGGQRGAWRPSVGRSGRVEHKITVKSYLDPYQASRTLWHEMRHAAQAEALCEGIEGTAQRLAALRMEHARQARWSYAVRPCEVDARSYESMADDMPLGR